MPDTESIAKLEAWVKAHPDSADTRFSNVTTGQEYTVRGLLATLVQERDSGEALADENLSAELRQIEEWVRGL